MKKQLQRIAAMVMALILLIGVVPAQTYSEIGDLLNNSSSKNEQLLSQLQSLWGDDSTAEEALKLLKEYGLVDEKGNVVTEWNGEIRLDGRDDALTLDELSALSESGEVTDDTTVTVDGTPITVKDLLLLAKIETELSRIEKTYFSGKDVDLSREQAENLLSIYEQLNADGGFLLQNSNAPDLTFASGTKHTARVWVTANYETFSYQDAQVLLRFTLHLEGAAAGQTVSGKFEVINPENIQRLVNLQPDAEWTSRFPDDNFTITADASGSAEIAGPRYWLNPAELSWDGDVTSIWNGTRQLYACLYNVSGAFVKEGVTGYDSPYSQTLPISIYHEKDFPTANTYSNSSPTSEKEYGTPQYIEMANDEKWAMQNKIYSHFHLQTDATGFIQKNGHSFIQMFPDGSSVYPYPDIVNTMGEMTGPNDSAASYGLWRQYLQYLHSGLIIADNGQFGGQEIFGGADIGYGAAVQTGQYTLLTGDKTSDSKAWVTTYKYPYQKSDIKNGTDAIAQKMNTAVASDLGGIKATDLYRFATEAADGFGRRFTATHGYEEYYTTSSLSGYASNDPDTSPRFKEIYPHAEADIAFSDISGYDSMENPRYYLSTDAQWFEVSSPTPADTTQRLAYVCFPTDGNRPKVTTMVQFKDKRAPSITNVSVPDREYQPGDTVPITVTYDEPVASGSTITVNGNGVSDSLEQTLTASGDTEGSWSALRTYLYTVPTDRVSNTFLKVTGYDATDMADNSGSSEKLDYTVADGKISTTMPMNLLLNPSAGTPTTADGQYAVKISTTLPTDTSLRNLLLGTPVQTSDADKLALGNVAASNDGGKTFYPLVLDDADNPTAATAVFRYDLTDSGTKTVEFYEGTFTYDQESGQMKSNDAKLVFGRYAWFTLEEPTPLTAEAITVTAPENWPTDAVPVYSPPANRTWQATVTGTHTWNDIVWYSDNKEVADIDAETGVVSLYGAGTANFYVRAVNGGLEKYQDTDLFTDSGTYHKKVGSITVKQGTTPYLTFPSNSISVRHGETATVRWSSNLVQKNRENGIHTTTFTLTLTDPSGKQADEWTLTYDGTKEDGTLTMGDSKTTIPMWTKGTDGSLTPNQSFSIPASLLTDTAADGYKLTIKGALDPSISVADGTKREYTAEATITVVSQPVTVRLTRPNNLYCVNNGTLNISYTLTNYDAQNNSSGEHFQLTVTNNATGEVVSNTTTTQANGGSISLDLSKANMKDGFRTIYDVSIQAKNTAEPDWSRDSFTLYIYDKSCLDIVVQPVQKNGKDVVSVSGDTVKMSNNEWIASLTQEQILALQRDITLQTAISINYGAHAWGEASDRIQWLNTDSGKAAVNYLQGAYYENIENLSYASYAPVTEFVLSGKNNGTTSVEAVHALAGDALSSSTNITVETLKDKLYLFQFYAGRTETGSLTSELSYRNGNGEWVTKTGDSTGRAAVYEPSGIASDVYVKATVNGEEYLGTVYQDKLVSQEKDAVSLELYPLNSLTLRKASTLDLYLKDENGKPYKGKVTIRAGVYRNDEYCEKAVVDSKNGNTNATPNEDYVINMTNGKYTFQYDLTQFSTDSKPNADKDNPVTAQDALQYVLEIRADGYYPALLVANGSLNAEDAVRIADRVVTLEKVTAGQENKPFIARQVLYYTGKESGYGTDVRGKSGKVGPSQAYPDMLMSTTVFWWGQENDPDNQPSVRYVDETGTVLQKQTTNEEGYPFCSMPVSRVTVPLDKAQLEHLQMKNLAKRNIHLVYQDASGTAVKDEEMAWKLVNSTELEDVTKSGGLLGSIQNLSRMIKNTKSDGVSVGGDFLTMGISLATSGGISIPGVSMTLAPTNDPTVFTGLVTVGLNNIEGDQVSGINANSSGADFSASPGLDEIKSVFKKGLNGTVNDMSNQVQAAASILKGNVSDGVSGSTSSGDSNKYYALQGWFEIEVYFDFDNQKWEFNLLSGGFTAGGGMGYQWVWNMQVGPVPMFFQLGVGAAGTVNFNAKIDANRQNNYLTELRLYAYLEAFGGVGFDYSVIALKLGLYGRVSLTAKLRWLNLAETAKAAAANSLTVGGEIGARFEVRVLFISYEKILWSQPIASYNTQSSNWDTIQDTWDNIALNDKHEGSLTPDTQSGPVSQVSLLSQQDGTGLYAADMTPSLSSRDYLKDYTRRYSSAGPNTSKFSLFSTKSADTNLVETVSNSYPQAEPSLTDDGGYLFFLDDQENSTDATALRAAVMEQNSNGGYDSKTVLSNEGYGDSGLSTSGSNHKVAAAWSRVTEKPAVTEPGQAVTTDVQAQMLASTDIFVAVPDGNSGWTVKNISSPDGVSNGVGDLSPVVARKGDHIFVAWRQVASSGAADLTDFSERDYIYYSVSNDGGKNFSAPAPLYNGTSGSIKGIQAAMLEDGTSAVAFSLAGEEQDLTNGTLDQNVGYAVVDTSGKVVRYVLMEENALGENPQITSVPLNDKQTFILGWHSVDTSGMSDIRLAAVDSQGNRVTGFADSLSGMAANSEVKLSANFRFSRGAESLNNLYILWSEAVGNENKNDTGDGSTSEPAHDIITGLRFMTEDHGRVTVTAAQRIIEMPTHTTIDSFDAYANQFGVVFPVMQSTYYDYDHPKTVTVGSQTIQLANEKASICTTVGQMQTCALRIDSIVPEYTSIRPGATVPVQLSVTNLGTQPISTLQFSEQAANGQKIKFDSSTGFTSIASGETRQLTLYLKLGDTVKDMEYCITANGWVEKTGTLPLDVPDVGIADTDVLVNAENGKRTLQFTLYNGSAVDLTADKSVQLALYTDSACENPVTVKGKPYTVTVSSSDLQTVNEGSYTCRMDFDLKTWLTENKAYADADGEVRDNGVPLYAKAVILSGKNEYTELNTSNNYVSIKLESLLKQNEEPVTIASVLNPGTDSAQVDIILQNNSIVDGRDGDVVVKLFDKEDNKVGSKVLTNVSLAAEERKSLTADLDDVTNAVRAEITYRKSTPAGTTDSSASALKFDGIPAALSDFVKQADGTYHASATVEQLAQTLVTATAQDSNAEITLNSEAIGTGSGAKNVPLNEGKNTITVTITTGGQSTTYVLDCTVTDSRAAQSLTADNVTGLVGDTEAIKLNGTPYGKVTYIVKSGEEAVTVDENGTLTFCKVGSAVVTVTAAGDSTHRPWTQDITVTVNQRTVSGIAFEDKQADYSGKPISHELTKPNGVRAVTYEYEGISGTAYEKSETAPTDAGTYQVTASFTMEDNYVQLAPLTATLTIRPKDISGAKITLGGESLIYNGEAQTQTVTAVALDGFTPTYTVSGNTGTAAQEYILTVTGTGNFTGTATCKWRIAKAVVTVRALDKSAKTGDKAPDLDAPVLDTDYTLTGLIGKDTLESSVSIKLITDKTLDMNTAGEYVLTPVVSGTDSRYDFKVESGKLTVTKRNTSSGGNSSGSVKPTPNPAPEDELNFIDVPKDSYFEEAVRWAVKESITNGTSANTFRPDASCTRAQIVTFLWRAAGSPEPERMSSFTDVSASAYYAKAVAWAVENGITVGTSDTTFSPEQICTRAHGVTFLYRAAKANVDSGSTAFTDVNENAYYAKAVRWAVDNGITNGISKSLFGPENSCTRAQIVTFLWRLYAEQ